MKINAPPARISARGMALHGQSMFQIMMRARELESLGNKVVHFEIGDPDYSLTKDLAGTVYRELEKGNGHYVSSQGVPELLSASSRRFGLSRGFSPTVEQMLVTPGANIQIFLILASIADPGDSILIPDPGFVTYREHCIIAGLVPVEYSLLEENEFQPTVEELKRLIGRGRVKALILNSPHNPTGSVYPESLVKEIFDVCQRNGVYLISDEVYSRQVFGPQKFFSPSAIDCCNERVFIVHSLSKTFGLTGWRIGVMTGPESIMGRVRLASEAILSCVPPFIQLAAAHALDNLNFAANEWIRCIEHRKRLFSDLLRGAEGIRLFESGGTFYCFGRLTGRNSDAIQVARELLERKMVAVVPGDHFGKLGRGYVRFALTSGDEECELGARRVAEYFGKSW